MRPRDLAELVALAALWGASFLFMRVAAAEFGPVALAAARVVGASALLLPLLAWRGESAALRRHWRPLLVVGIANSALPFVAFSYAALTLNAGLSAIFNATTPLMGALVAAVWLRQRLDGSRAVGMAIGFAGVLWLAWDKAGLRADGGEDAAAAVLACLAATLCYGWSANYTKQRLGGVPPMAVAAGSQLAAAALLAPPALWQWPAQPPGATAWMAVVALALLSTGVAYVLFFRLIAHAGATQALSVTYLIPAFAVLWGALFLGETLTAPMLGGCAVILLGTALTTGLIGLPRWRRAGA